MLFGISLCDVVVALDHRTQRGSNECLHQDKWSSVVGKAIPSQMWSCFLALPPTPASSQTCLCQWMVTAFPSCLGGGWLSADGLPPAYRGLQATPAGLSSTQWGVFNYAPQSLFTNIITAVADGVTRPGCHPLFLIPSCCWAAALHLSLQRLCQVGKPL